MQTPTNRVNGKISITSSLSDIKIKTIFKQKMKYPTVKTMARVTVPSAFKMKLKVDDFYFRYKFKNGTWSY